MKLWIMALFSIFSVSASAMQGFMSIGSSANQENPRLITLCKHTDSPWYSCANPGSSKSNIYEKISYDAKNKKYVTLAFNPKELGLPVIACLSIEDPKREWKDCSPELSSGVSPGYYRDLAHDETGNLIIMGTNSLKDHPKLVSACKSANEEWTNCSPASDDNIAEAHYSGIHYGKGDWFVVGGKEYEDLLVYDTPFTSARYFKKNNAWLDWSFMKNYTESYLYYMFPQDVAYAGNTWNGLWMTVGGYITDSDDDGNYIYTFAAACKSSEDYGMEGWWGACGKLDKINTVLDGATVFGNDKLEFLTLVRNKINENTHRESTRAFFYSHGLWVEHSDGLPSSYSINSRHAAYGNNHWAAVLWLNDLDNMVETRIATIQDGSQNWQDSFIMKANEGQMRGIYFGELGILAS